MNFQGYYHYPDIRDKKIVFVSEDDLWLVSKKGGIPRRLTANLATLSYPKISPDGKWIALTSAEEGHGEIYILPTEGGKMKRLTYLGANSRCLTWDNNSKNLYFTSRYKNAFDSKVYKISSKGGEPKELEVGQANSISFGPTGLIIGRHVSDPARWKRYRGGTAGEFWIDKKGNNHFTKILDELKTNLASPMWINNRIYFISDHEGYGNIYSCNIDGKDIKRHTDLDKFYARNAQTDGESIVFHAGGDLYYLNLKTDKTQKVKIEYHSSKTQTNRKFVKPSQYLQGYDLNPRGTHLSIATRGKIFSMANWTGPVKQHGQRDGVRYRIPTWLQDDKHFLATTDEINGEDRLLMVNPQKNKEKIFKELEVGRIHQISPSPTANKAALINHKNEILIVDCDKNKLKIVDSSNFTRPSRVSWSPDGQWITYDFQNTAETRIIKLYNLEKDETHEITHAVMSDTSPTFSPDGKYIYFAGHRVFYPVYDSIQFELSFLKSCKIYSISLNKDFKRPTIREPKAPAPVKDKASKEKEDKEIKVSIDLDGIKDRVTELPMKAGIYFNINIQGKKVFFQEMIRDGLEKKSHWSSTAPSTNFNLKYFNLETHKTETLIPKMTSYQLSLQRSNMIVRQGNQLMVLKTGEKPNKKAKTKFSLEDSKINLSRIKVGILPREEWKQIYKEAWLLQKEHFWNEKMSGVDWEKIFKRYWKLLDRINSRGELSDVIWEMQGELGTSHCYEFGGDYRKSPVYRMGKLGCSYKLSKNKKHYKFKDILKGDPANSNEISPLLAPGVNIKEGDHLYEVDGEEVNEDRSPRELLVNKAGREIVLTIRRKGKKKKEFVTVKTLKFEHSLLYRNWVEKNRDYVHKKSKGKIGYVHIPDMGQKGFAEFHRYYLTECRFDALIVDVRYNGGGHVSQLLLEKLKRKRIGYDITRWSKEPESYPGSAVAGPIIAITNEFAGSDGDIFSHSFKLMGIGKLIGKRTWGGVIGINGQYSLSDGTITTQPEYSFWFEDVGWKVENYGTDPDIEIDITPEDYVKNRDPQLDKAIKELKNDMKRNPVKKPDFSNKPDLSLPKLPKRK